MDKGVKQGDSLSPLLFITVMDKIVKSIKIKTNGLDTIVGYRRPEPVKLNNLMYADDIVLIADKEKKMQRLVNLWVEEIERLGMEVNEDKSKIMIVKEKQTGELREGGIKC